MSDANFIKNFMSQKRIILFGASRSGKKFGNAVLKEMSGKGYQIFPVHPECKEINGITCYPDISSVPDDVKSVLMIIPPKRVLEVIPDLIKHGIVRAWLQQGAESPEVIKQLQENDIEIISHECILMFTEPVKSIHRFHRWIWKIAGKYPDMDTA